MLSPLIHFEPALLRVDHDPQTDPARPWVAAVWHFMDYSGIKVAIHPGFRCDFDSVPGWLRWLIKPAGPQLRAAMWHDALYRLQPFGRSVADAIFWDVLKQDKVPALIARGMYYAVRMFGSRAWEQSRANLQTSRATLYAAAQRDGITVTRYQ